MARIKQYQQQVNNERTPHEYLKADTHGAFGEQIARAYVSLGESIDSAEHALIRYNDQRNRTKALELSNELYKWEEEKLHSKDGYYNQFGRNASGKAQFYIDDFDNYARTKAKELGLDGFGSQQYVEFVINQRKEKISRGIMAHDLKQTQEAEKNEAGLLLQNLQNSAIEYRNNDFELDKSLNEIKKASYIYGKGSNLDDTQIELMQQANTSDTIAKVISSALSEGSLKAQTLYEKYKDQLTPDAKVRLGDAVNNLNNKYMARDFAQNCFGSGLTEQQAFERAYADTNIESRDSKIAAINFLYGTRERLEKEQYQKLMDDTLDKIVQTQNPDDIPNEIKPADRKKFLQYCLNGGASDGMTYNNLFEMSYENADNFAKLNLNQYALNMSDSQLKQLKELQHNISEHGYTTFEMSDVKEVAKQFGFLSGVKKDELAEVMNAYVNAEERRRGRKLYNKETQTHTDEYAQRMQWFAYQDKNGKSTYDIMKNFTADKEEFYDKVASGVLYYTKVNRKMPDAKAFNDIVNSWAYKLKNQEKEGIIQYTKNTQGLKPATVDVSNNVIRLYNAMGLKNIQPTSAYRAGDPQHHGKGEAVDFPMANPQVTPQQKIQLVQGLVALNQYYNIKVGTSDPDILNNFKSHVGGEGKLIQNLTDYDNSRGTNHKDHIHITVRGIREQNRQTTVKMSAPNGQIYNVPIDKVNMALLNGMERI